MNFSTCNLNTFYIIYVFSQVIKVRFLAVGPRREECSGGGPAPAAHHQPAGAPASLATCFRRPGGAMPARQRRRPVRSSQSADGSTGTKVI